MTLCLVHVRKESNRIALSNSLNALSYEALDTKISQMTSYLKKRGVKENTNVCFDAVISMEVIALFFAIFRLKAIACPLSHFIPTEEKERRLDLLRSPFFLPFSEIVAAFNHFDRSFEVETDLTKPSLFLFTSGSSGRPKIAALSLYNLIKSAEGANLHFSLKEDDSWLLNLPLFHVSGLGVLFRSFLQGAEVILSKEASFMEKVSRLSLVPTQLYRLMKQEETLKALQKKKSILLGGAACPISLWEEAKRASIPLIASYGMTEMGSLITATQINDKEYSAGKSLAFREYRLKDEEIEVQGETLFLGYYNKDLGIQKKEGFFPTRDIGRIDSEGNLHILGRKDAMFISGGENIHPEEIEKALKNIEGIEEAIVVSVPDKEWGRVPVAFLQKKESLSIQEISFLLKEKLDSLKTPKRFLPLPESQGLKPNRTTLQSEAEKIYL